MIRYYDAESLKMWNRDEVQVQLLLPGRTKPLGYCDGSDDDEDELRAMARTEGVEDLNIHKKRLKTGRQIWTLGDLPDQEEDADDVWDPED